MSTPTDVERLDREHVFGTWTRQRDHRPREIVDAHGATLVTADGRDLVDLSSQMACANLGYSADGVAEAVAAQARSVPYARSDLATEPRARLGEAIAEVTPGDLSKTYFSTTGSGAVEGALAVARAYTGERKVLARHTSYHGTSLATMAVTGDPRRHSAAVEVPGVIRGPDFAGDAIDPAESLALIDERLAVEDGTVAAVIAEPVVGSSGGVLVPPEGYLADLRDIAHDHGALLIADEVMTGFGRTGAWFACDRFGVEPDVMALAKGLTGSYAPLGATVVSESVAEFFEDEPFMQGHTFSGHPVACAAGLAAIDAYRDGAIDRARDLGPRLGDRLDALAGDHPGVSEVRGLGLFYGLELAAAAGPGDSGDPGVTEDVLRAAVDAGAVLFGRHDAVIVAPPLSITDDELDAGLAALDAALDVADGVA